MNLVIQYKLRPVVFKYSGNKPLLVGDIWAKIELEDIIFQILKCSIYNNDILMQEESVIGDGGGGGDGVNKYVTPSLQI